MPEAVVIKQRLSVRKDCQKAVKLLHLVKTFAASFTVKDSIIMIVKQQNAFLKTAGLCQPSFYIITYITI